MIFLIINDPNGEESLEYKELVTAVIALVPGLHLFWSQEVPGFFVITKIYHGIYSAIVSAHVVAIVFIKCFKYFRPGALFIC